MTLSPDLSDADIRLLRLAASDGSGMYPGIEMDFRPKALGKLYRLGLLRPYYPHNGCHKDRYVTSEKGDALLTSLENGK